MHKSLLLGSAIIIAGCSGRADGPTDPGPGNPGFTVSGAVNVADTIGATLSQPLRLVLRDASGQRLAGTRVRFSALLSPASTPFAYVATSNSVLGFASSETFTTTSNGSIDTVVKLGQFAGLAGIVIETVDSPFHAIDTVRFAVLPGAAVSMSTNPRDTLITFGKPLQVKATVFDRSRNVRPDVVTYRAFGPAIAVSSSGLVTTNAYGSSGVVISSGSFVDTSLVTVVPAGTMAARKGDYVMITRLDGELIDSIRAPAVSPSPPTPIQQPEWTADGQAFYTLLGRIGEPSSLYLVDMTGKTTLFGACPFAACPSGPAVFRGPAVFNSFSPSTDGRFMYLSSTRSGEGVLYRVQLSDGSVDQLSGPDPDPSGPRHRWPDISPDGSTLVFQNDVTAFGPFTVRFFEVATRTIRPLTLEGERPRWSPDGNQIAFVNAGHIWVARADGTGLRRLTTSNNEYLAGLTWSPDGHWVLGHAWVNAVPTVVVVGVDTSIEIPLTFTRGWREPDGLWPVPSWRPRS